MYDLNRLWTIGCHFFLHRMNSTFLKKRISICGALFYITSHTHRARELMHTNFKNLLHIVFCILNSFEQKFNQLKLVFHAVGSIVFFLEAFINCYQYNNIQDTPLVSISNVSPMRNSLSTSNQYYMFGCTIEPQAIGWVFYECKNAMYVYILDDIMNFHSGASVNINKH